MKHENIATTLYSLGEEVPTPSSEPDRRDGDRQLTLFRVGSIRIDGDKQLCLIKNISAGGMKIRAYSPLREGQSLVVELKGNDPIDARVAWIEGDNVGLEFEAPIEVLAFLTQQHATQHPRMPRIEIDCPVEIYHNGTSITLRALDISQGGIKLEMFGPMPTGADDVCVLLPGMAPIRGSVRWQYSGHAGVNFHTPLALETLVDWLGSQRNTARRAS